MLRVFALCAALFVSAGAIAQSAATSQLSQAKLVGEGRMKYVFWDVYDAALYAPGGQFDWDQPFALELTYLMDFTGEDIAERSAEEIRDLGFDDEMKLAAWFSQMKTIFPDVKETDRITGVFHPKGESVFYLGDTVIGKVSDPEFGKWFARIWLDDNTSDPALRKQLLGMR